MSSKLEAVTFDVVDALANAVFWAGMLDREVVIEPGGAALPGDQTQVGLRFVTSTSTGVDHPRLHLHVTSTSAADQQRCVDHALRLGGRRRDAADGADAADEGFVVLADPAGLEFCVIEPGNTFLAGTGRLGEVTCDGTRAVGMFWRDALGWPLVWDEGDQTAIQAPDGGTKISWDAWDASSELPHSRTTRQRFAVVSDDPGREVERLVSLGATRLDETSSGITLVDPDGNPFSLRMS